MANLVDTSVNGDLRVTGTMFGTQAGNYATCATAAGTAAKAVTISGFTLTTGIHVFVKFTVTNTAAVASLTLNVSGTGAKSMKYRGGNLPAVGTLSASRVYEFIYDGTNWELVGDLDTNTQTVTGVKGNSESSYRTGQVNLTAANIGASASDHTHGNIGNGGTLTDTAAAATGNDYVVIRDADNNKVQTSTIKGTDVADAVSKKHSHSTITLSTTAQAYDGTNTLALPSTDPYTSARTPASHTHGNIANGGTLTDTAAAAAGNDYMVIRDADNAKIQTSTIKGTDVADAVSKKHSHSTLTLSTTAQEYDGSHTLALPSTDPYTSARTPASHTHGNITNGGALQTNDITIASGDKLVVTDSSDSSKVARTSVSFDGSTTTTALTPKGTFEAFAKSGDITSAINNLDSNKTSTDGTNVQVKVTEADGKISAVNITTDTTANRNEGVYYVVGTTDYPAWAANTAYAVNDNVISGGKAYYCKTAHTSGSSFDSSKWTAIATPVIKGTVTGVTALYTGMKIALKWPITGGSSSTYLNINNLGNVYIRRNNGNTTTHLPANTVCFLTYDGTYWQWADWDSNSTYSGMVDAYLNNAADAAKSASSTNFKLTSGVTIMLANNAANTKNAALTLNVNGTGAKTLYINGSASSASNYTIPVGTFPCYYDGTNWYLWTDGTFQVSQLRYRAMLGEHQATMRYHIQVGNTGSNPKGWCSILRVTKTSGYGSYDALRVHGMLYDGNGNWEYQQERRIEFQAIVNITSNTANLYLGKTTLTADNWIRLIKVADRDYELQYNAATANYDLDVYYQYEGNASAYVTRYTTYTATTVSGTAITSEKLLPGSIAYRADADGDGNNIKATYFKSSGNVTLVSGTATKIGTQNGTDVKLTLPTIPASANNGALKIGLNGGTATSKFTANQSGDSTLTFATGSAAGKISVDGTDVAVNGWSDKADKSSTVSTVAWDSTNKKITKTINGSTTDVVTAATLKTAMSLDNVNNTSDADKPVSTAQQTALDKKVNIANVDITSQSTTILALVQAMATSQIHYKRFYTTSDGGSSTISDKPTGSTNAGFMLEAYCNRYVSSSDWRYVLLCYVQASRPRIAWVTNSSTSISWSDFNTDTHYTTHLYAGDGTAANVATTNGNTKLTVVDNSTVRNTVTLQGSNNVSVSSDTNGVVTIDGTHTHTTSIASDSSSGTVVTLAHNTQYKLTAGGTSVLFKTPADSNTDTLVKANKVTDTTAYKILASKTADPQGAATEANYAASCTINGAGTMGAVAYSVNSKCTLQFNTTTNALDFVFN